MRYSVLHKKEDAMLARRLAFAMLVCVAATAAWAGAPLKGVDVKLGKNPGGTPAARTTNAEGKSDFGVVPAGSYYVVVDGAKAGSEADAQIEIHGVNEGTVKKRSTFAQKQAVRADA